MRSFQVHLFLHKPRIFGAVTVLEHIPLLCHQCALLCDVGQKGSVTIYLWPPSTLKKRKNTLFSDVFSYLAQHTLDRYVTIYQINSESNRQKQREWSWSSIIMVIMPHAPCMMFFFSHHITWYNIVITYDCKIWWIDLKSYHLSPQNNPTWTPGNSSIDQVGGVEDVTNDKWP